MTWTKLSTLTLAILLGFTLSLAAEGLDSGTDVCALTVGDLAEVVVSSADEAVPDDALEALKLEDADLTWLSQTGCTESCADLNGQSCPANTSTACVDDLGNCKLCTCFIGKWRCCC